MVLESLREQIEKSFEDLKNGAIAKKDCAVDYINETINSFVDDNKESVCTGYQRSNEIVSQNWKTCKEALQLDEAWEYRNRIIADYSLAQRINFTLAMNFPVFLFSSGLRRIRNPIVFSAVTSVLILPEIINPFNRR